MSNSGNGGVLGEGVGGGGGGDRAHWVRWHRSYEDPDSALSTRLRLVQDGVREVLDQHPPGPIQVVSICAGQGRDVIDVEAGHQRQSDVRARLVELDPALVDFARHRATAAGVHNQIEVLEGDARETLRGLAEPVDLLLLDGAKGLYPAVLALVEQRLRPGALVVADNADWSPEYLERVRSPAHGYMSVPFADDVELSMRIG